MLSYPDDLPTFTDAVGTMLRIMDERGRETWTMCSVAGPAWQATLHEIRALPESPSDEIGRV